MNLILHYIPYVLLFAAATALIYGWGLWRSMRQNQDLSNLLTAKLPFTSEQIAVTDPKAFLNSILPYMVKQKLITEEKENGKILYRYRK